MGNTNIPIYDAILDDNGIGLTAISLVDYPATFSDFLAMSDVEKIWMSSNEKRELVGALLIPNQLILRYNSAGEPYYMRWKAEVIRQVAERFLMRGNWNAFTIMHENIDAPEEERLQKDIYLQRLWIIEDKNDDAIKKYGFHLPVGTLMCKVKVHNRSVWQRVRSGELKGFSIEAFANLISENKMLEISYSKMDKFDYTEKQFSLFQKFVAFVNSVASDAQGIADEAKKDDTNSGEVELKYWIDNDHYMIVDAEGYVRDAEANLVDAGEYKLADGNVLVVGQDNKFLDVKSIAEDNADGDKAEAPIAEKAEKEDEEDKGDGEETAEEDKAADGEDKDEDAGVDAEDTAETSDEDDEEPDKDRFNEEPELPAELVPYDINGEEYLLPQAVVSYIESLKDNSAQITEELNFMKAKTPSAEPVPTVIKQSAEKEEQHIFSLTDAIKALNSRRK